MNRIPIIVNTRVECKKKRRSFGGQLNANLTNKYLYLRCVPHYSIGKRLLRFATSRMPRAMPIPRFFCCLSVVVLLLFPVVWSKAVSLNSAKEQWAPVAKELLNRRSSPQWGSYVNSKGSISFFQLMQDSYSRHIEFICRGIPMPIVKKFYRYALRQVLKKECQDYYEGDDDLYIWKTCINRWFASSDGYAVKTLLRELQRDKRRRDRRKLFPHFLGRRHLPKLEKRQEFFVDQARDRTMKLIDQYIEAVLSRHRRPRLWIIFPKDEKLRIDKWRRTACWQYKQRRHHLDMRLSASTLTAYVFGIVQQIVLANPNDKSAQRILREHVRFVYSAARCSRKSYRKMQIPTVYVKGFVTSARLSLLKSKIKSSDTFISSFPRLDDIREVIRGSRKFLWWEVKVFSSMYSLGRARYLQSNGTHIFPKRLSHWLSKRASIQKFTKFHGKKEKKKLQQNPRRCKPDFKKHIRLEKFGDPWKNCCSIGCLRKSGRRLAIQIVNEMCCSACNQAFCDVNKLSRVQEVDAFQFPQSY